jgi:fatty-acyl-CoA synthase
MEKVKGLGQLAVFKNFKPVKWTFANMVDEAAAEHPDREAFIIGNTRLTFLQFQQRANELAKGLINLSIHKGDHVAILIHNIIEFPLAAIATAKAGGVIVTCNTRFKRDELLYVLNKAKVSTLITIDQFPEANIDYIKMLNSLAPELASSNRENLELKNLPYLKRVIVLKTGTYPGCYSLDDILGGAKSVTDGALSERQSMMKPDDNGVIIFTSGTTGFPKGVLLRYSPIITSAATRKILLEVNEKDKTLSYIPYFTVYGIQTGLVAPFIFRAPVVVGNIFDPGEFLQLIEDEKITMLSTVPAMIEALFEHPKFSTTDFTTLKTGNIGGALCPPEMMRRARSKKKGWGMHCPGMTTTYGLTETHSGISAISLNDPDEKSLHTVGRLYPLNEMKVVDPVTGEAKKAGEEGELIVRGYSIMSGYFEDPKQTQEKIRDGWLHTGDLGIVDEDGYIKITGRATDMIITGGFNVYPKEIENKILEHPAVLSVSAFGVPDKKYGEVPMVHIILKAGRAIEPDEIRAFCKEKMGSYKVPKYIEFVNEFPINPGGKIQKFKQKDMAIKKLGLDSK